MLLLRVKLRFSNAISNISLKTLFHKLHIWINVNRSWSKVFELRVRSYWDSYACFYDYWLHIIPSFEKALCLISKSKWFHFLRFRVNSIEHMCVETNFRHFLFALNELIYGTFINIQEFSFKVALLLDSKLFSNFERDNNNSVKSFIFCSSGYKL